MQKMIRAVTNVFPKEYSLDFIRAGWCYMKVRFIDLSKLRSSHISFSETEINLVIVVGHVADAVT